MKWKYNCRCRLNDDLKYNSCTLQYLNSFLTVLTYHVWHPSVHTKAGPMASTRRTLSYYKVLLNSDWTELDQGSDYPCHGAPGAVASTENLYRIDTVHTANGYAISTVLVGGRTSPCLFSRRGPINPCTFLQLRLGVMARGCTLPCLHINSTRLNPSQQTSSR